MKANHRVVIAILSIVLLITTIVMAPFTGKRKAKADDNESPFALNVNSENLPEGFFENQAEACEITGRFFEYLRNTYGATFDDSVYTVCGVRAESFPSYYAGNYINTEGRLVVQIAEAFYSPDYKESAWYQEFVDIVGTENFYRHPMKYSFSELVNAISSVTIGNLAEDFSAIGVTIVDASIDEYTNRVYVHFGSQEDYDATITMLGTDIYSASVAEYTLSDYIGVYPGEGISTSSVGNATFSVACRVRRSEPGGSYTYGYLTCAHGFSGTSNVYLYPNYPNAGSGTLIGVSYSFNQHYGGSADVAFIQTNTSVTAYDTVYLATTTLYHSLSTANDTYNLGKVVYKRGIGTNSVKHGVITNNNFAPYINGQQFSDMVIADFQSKPGDSGCIVYSEPSSANYAYPIGVFKGGPTTSGTASWGYFTKMYNALAALQSGTLTYSLY